MILRWWLARRGHPNDSGMTVIEVTIASALLLLITSTIFTIMVSAQNADRRAQAVVNNEQETRFVLTEIARDIRASNPTEVFTSAATYSNSIQLYLGESATQTRVRWVYDTDPASATFKQLRREVLNTSTGAIVSTTTRLKRVQNAVRAPVVPLFKYYGQNGGDLVAAGNAADVGNCAIRVTITLTADSNPGPEPFTVTQDVEVRNRLPGGVGCG